MTRCHVQPWVRPHHYTPVELLEAAIADLRVDIRCAERDGLFEYAEQCRAELAVKRQRLQAMCSPA